MNTDNVMNIDLVSSLACSFSLKMTSGFDRLELLKCIKIGSNPSNREANNLFFSL